MGALSLEIADKVVEAALEKRRQMAFPPMTVAVLDAGGRIKVVKRQDGASLLRPEIAIGKAWGVLGLGFGGRELARRAAQVPLFFNALSDLSGGRMVPVAGGVIIRAQGGDILGSVGISGGTSEDDEVCAVHGVESVGLVADTGD